VRQTTVVVADAYVLVDPWIPELEHQSEVKRRMVLQQPVLTASGNWRVDRRPVVREEQLYTLDKDSTDQHQVGYSYPGLLDRISDGLAKLRVAYTVMDLSTKPEPLDLSQLSVDLRPGQPEILQVMGTERRATIKAATGLGKTETIVQFLRACGKSKVAVVTFKGDARDSIYDRVRTGVPEKTVCLLRANSSCFDADIYVLADKSLHRLPADNIDIVLIDEVHGAGSDKSFERLLALAGKRVYGFSATPKGRHDKSDMAIEALCGKVKVDLSYRFSVDTGANVPLYVYVYEAQGPEGLENKPDFVKEKVGIWCNRSRNGLLAHLCRDIPEDDQTLIVCRTLEHVLNIHRLLPDYTCVFRQPSGEREEELLERQLLPPGWKHLPKFRIDADGSRTDFESAKLKKVIATPVWREAMDFKQLKWLVRADGTVNEIACIQIGGRLARKTDGKDCAVLIDFYDRFSGFERRSEARMARYRKEGWIVQRIT